MSSASQSDLRRQLEPVRRRLKHRLTLRCAVEGFAGGAAVAATVAMCGIVLFPQTSTAIGLAALLAGPVVGAILATILKTDLRVAARRVDEHYDLKDRVITALQILAKKSPTTVETFQVREASQHLQNLDPAKVIPFSFLTVKRPLLRGILFAAAAVVLMTLPTLVEFGKAEGKMTEKVASQPKKTPESTVEITTQLVTQSLEGHLREDPEESQAEYRAPPRGEWQTIRRYFTGIDEEQ